MTQDMLMGELAHAVFHALIIGLVAWLVVQALDPHAADCQTAMYCNRYPSVEGKHFPEGALRIGAHTDFELLTLLFTRLGDAPHIILAQ